MLEPTRVRQALRRRCPARTPRSLLVRSLTLPSDGGGLLRARTAAGAVEAGSL